MIGDAGARGKRGNSYAAGPEFKKKHPFKGRSYISTDGKPAADSGGGPEKHATAKRMHKGMKPSTPGVADRQAPHKQKERKEVRHVDQGQILDEWCAGKRGSYKK